MQIYILFSEFPKYEKIAMYHKIPSDFSLRTLKYALTSVDLPDKNGIISLLKTFILK